MAIIPSSLPQSLWLASGDVLAAHVASPACLMCSNVSISQYSQCWGGGKGMLNPSLYLVQHSSAIQLGGIALPQRQLCYRKEKAELQLLRKLVH